MARTVNATVHAIRRDAFVDVAQGLIQAKGYEEMSIQDILDALDASRGAFYHYFDSKADLLEAVVERMVDAATASLTPVVDNPDLSAVEKLEGVFAGLARWKDARTDLMLALLQAWRSDENAIVREKLRQGIVIHLAPLLAAIVEQGKAEGRFTASSPDEVARVLVSLIQSANEAAVELFFARQADLISFEIVERTLDAYREAYERILGLPAGSLDIGDRTILRKWFG
jgi:AcrR family transcriptional regulator